MKYKIINILLFVFIFFLYSCSSKQGVTIQKTRVDGSNNSIYQTADDGSRYLPKDQDEAWFKNAKIQQTIFKTVPKQGDKYQIPGGVLHTNGLYEKLLNSHSERVDLHTGDIILRITNHEDSLGIALSCLGGYSHSGMILRDDGEIYVVDVIPNDGIVRKNKLKLWLSDQDFGEKIKILQIMVRRPHGVGEKQIKEIQKTLHTLTGRNLYRTDNNGINPYCTGFINSILKKYLNNSLPIGIKKYMTVVYKNLLSHMDKVCKENAKKCNGISRYRSLLKNKGKKYLDILQDDIITPSSYEWSNSFTSIHWEYSNRINLNNYDSLLRLYNKLLVRMNAFHAIDGKPLNTPDFELEKIFYALDYPPDHMEILFYIIQLYRNEKIGELFNSQNLIYNLMAFYAKQDATYELIVDSLLKVRSR